MIRKRQQALTAFTLIELLVVISITGLLIAILLPALANARKASQNTVCLSNLRQMYLYMTGYAADWRNTFPCSRTQASNFSVHRVLDKKSYITNRKVWDCPSDTTRHTNPGGGFSGSGWGSKSNISYNYHRACGLWNGKSSGNIWYKPYIPDLAKRPVNDPIFFDLESGTATGNNMAYSNSFIWYREVWGTHPSNALYSGRHIGGTANTVAGDGHAENYTVDPLLTQGQALAIGQTRFTDGTSMP